MNGYDFKIIGEKDKESLQITIPLTAPSLSHYKDKAGNERTNIVFCEVGSRFGGGQDFVVRGIPARFSLRAWVPDNASGRSSGVVESLSLSQLLDLQKSKLA